MSQQSTTSRTRRELVAWRNAVFAVFILSGLATATWVARIPGVRDDLGFGKDPSAVGLLILGLSVGAVVGLAASSPVLVRFGPHKGMVATMLLAAAGTTLIGAGSTLLHAVPVVAIGLVVLGIGNGMLDVMMNVEGTAVEREIGKTLMPLMHACFSLGTVVGAGIGAAAAALGVAVAWHLFAVAVVLAVGTIVAVRFIPREADLGDEDVVTERVPFGERFRAALAVWADWRLILIGVVILGMAFGEGSANDWITLGVVDGHHQSNSTGAAVFSCFVAAMTVGRVLGGPIVDRIGRANAIRATAAMGALGLVLFIVGGPLWLVILGTLLWGFGVSLGFPLGMSAAADGAANPAARVSAVAIIGYCAFLVGPPLIGFLGAHWGILSALAIIPVLLVGAFFAAPAVRPAASTVSPSSASAEG